MLSILKKAVDPLHFNPSLSRGSGLCYAGAYLFFTALISVNLGCAGPSQNISSLTLNQQVQRLENQVAYLNQMQAQSVANQQKVTELTAQLDQLNQQLTLNTDQITQLQQKVQALETAKPASTAAQVAPGQALKSKVATPAPVVSAAEQAMYQKAYGLLIKKQYSASLQAFQRFIKQYPKSDRVTDASYWMGELYLTEGHPDLAAEQFRKVVRDTSSPKRPDAMMALGTIFLASGDTAHAKQNFETVIKEYPKTQAAEMAASKLKSLKTNA